MSYNAPMNRRCFLALAAAAPVAVAVAPQAVEPLFRLGLEPFYAIGPQTVETSGLTCRFYSSYTNAARDAQRTINWYVGGGGDMLSWPRPAPRKRYRRIETRFDPARLPS